MGWHDLVGREGETITAAQMTVRGLIIFAYGLGVIRFAGHRIFGKIGAFDIVLSVIVGSNLSRTLTGNAPLGATLAATSALVALHLALSHLSLHVPALGWLIKGRATRLVAGGRIDERAMRRQGISLGDLESAMREKGIRGVDQCDEAYLERNGAISVVKKTPPRSQP